jgi:UDP-glucose 4-epimerase
MKILVTGGAGFIGSHLVDRLAADAGNEVIIYDNLFRGRLENIAQHRDNPRLAFIEGDIRDYGRLLDAMRGAEQVFHLGAQSNVMGAVTDVDYSFNTNVVGTYNVLKAARETGARVAFSSSREVYGEARYLPVDEEHPIGSKNTYGASKVAGEMYCQVFANLFGVPVAVLRLSNVYGRRDFGRVIPLWLGRARQGLDLEVYGGKQTIDFVWIDQVVEAFLRAAGRDLAGQPVNIGSGQATAILDLAQRILALVGGPSQIVLRPAREAEVVRFTANVTRMRQRLGLEPPADPLAYLPGMLDG